MNCEPSSSVVNAREEEAAKSAALAEGGEGAEDGDVDLGLPI